MKYLVSVLFRGMCVGGTMLVPGVSGGSMAMILGIYDKLVSSVSSFFKHKKESAVFLALFCAGAAVGMVLFARPLLALIDKFPMPMMYLFIGAVLGGVPLIYKEAGIKKISWSVILYVIIGIAFVMLFELIPATESALAGKGLVQVIVMVAAGIFAAVALILPGISISYVLLLMGIYDTVMEAIGTLQIVPLIPMGIGLVLGIILTTKLLETAMTRCPVPTYMIILGFILGSVIQVFPGIPQGLEWLSCVLAFGAGYLIIYLISRAESAR